MFADEMSMYCCVACDHGSMFPSSHDLISLTGCIQIDDEHTYKPPPLWPEVIIP